MGVPSGPESGPCNPCLQNDTRSYPQAGLPTQEAQAATQKLPPLRADLDIESQSPDITVSRALKVDLASSYVIVQRLAAGSHLKPLKFVMSFNFSSLQGNHYKQPTSSTPSTPIPTPDCFQIYIYMTDDSGCPEIHYVGQADFELTEVCLASACN